VLNGLPVTIVDLYADPIRTPIASSLAIVVHPDVERPIEERPRGFERHPHRFGAVWIPDFNIERWSVIPIEWNEDSNIIRTVGER
jgi:hypothetical protein